MLLHINKMQGITAASHEMGHHRAWHHWLYDGFFISSVVKRKTDMCVSHLRVIFFSPLLGS